MRGNPCAQNPAYRWASHFSWRFRHANAVAMAVIAAMGGNGRSLRQLAAFFDALINHPPRTHACTHASARPSHLAIHVHALWALHCPLQVGLQLAMQLALQFALQRVMALCHLPKTFRSPPSSAIGPRAGRSGQRGLGGCGAGRAAGVRRVRTGRPPGRGARL